MTHRQLLPTFLILLAFSACNRQPETTRQSLNGTWRLTGTGTETVPGTGTGTETGTGTGTETGTVPGALHLDLADDSALFVAGGETEWAWIDSLAPTYSRTFEAKMAGTQDLVFEGIDTYATIFLNGILLGQTHNAHRPWRFPVGDVLRHDSANELIVQFASTVRVGREKLVAHPHPIPASNEPMPVGERTSVFARKPAYAFGWDWGPRFVGCGITGDVYLEARGERGISDARLDVLELREGAARVRMTIHGHGFSAGVGATVETPDSTFQMSLEAGRDGEWWAEWIWPEPPLWWPHTHGNPHLTPVHLTIDEAIEHNFQAGLRQIEWVQAPDSLGRSFALHVNGEPVYCRGANVIPTHFFLAQNEPRRLVEEAVELNMNMLRVWGGATYASEEMLEACDEAGVLIWQDFPFACAMVPTDSAFHANVAEEAAMAVRRLAGHPSIAIFCGNNESLTGWKKWNWQEQFAMTAADSLAVAAAYDRMFHELLPAVVDAEAPGMQYWPTSPSVGPWQLESDTAGDRHDWRVWFNAAPFDAYGEAPGRFVSEFGLQGLPSSTVIDQIQPAAPLTHPAILDRQRSRMPWIAPDFDGMDMMALYAHDVFGVDLDSLGSRDDAIFWSQWTQAEGLRRAILAHRSNAPETMGSLYWQLNDVWPALSWSTTDFAGHHKIARSIVRKANSDVHPLFEVRRNKEMEADLILRMSFLGAQRPSDLLLHLKFIDPQTGLIPFNDSPLRVPESREMTVDLWDQFMPNHENMFIHWRLTHGDGTPHSDGIEFIGNPGELELAPESGLTVEPGPVEGTWNFIAPATTPVLGVAITPIDGENASPNAFHLMPGEERIVVFNNIPKWKTWHEAPRGN